MPWAPKVIWFKKKWRQPGQTPNRVDMERVPVFYLKCPFLKPAKAFYLVNALSQYWWIYRFIRKNLSNKNFDIILARPLIPTGYSACLLSKKLNIPVVCEGTGSDIKIYPYFNSTSKKMFNKVIKVADKITANAQNLATKVDAHEGTETCNVAYRGVNIEAFKPLNSKSEIRKSLEIEKDERIALFVGKLSPQKGICDLLAAFKITLSQFHQASLYLIGENAFEKNIEQIAKEEDLYGKVHYLGQKPQKELNL
jgi:glycosyltransferase involved in cell wall biosynthesis